jgi:hypothetical protein
MVFNDTFNNISVILWLSVLLVEETGKNHWPSLLCEPISRRVVMWLVHATDKTWCTVLYHHTMYVISLSNISSNFKQISKVELKCVQYSEGDYILYMTSRYFFRSFTNEMLYHYSVVIKEWCDVARDVLCRTTLTWRHTIEMWDKTQ